MIHLTATNHILELLTSSTSNIKVNVAWADLTSTTLAGGSSQVSITTAATTTIVAAPAAGTTRQVKAFTARNTGGSSNVLTLKFDIAGTEFEIISATLEIGETLVMTEGRFFVKTVAGLEKNVSGTGFPIGNLAINQNNLEITSSADPAPPVAGKVILYGKEIAGRQMLKWMPPSGVDMPIQAGLFFNQVSLIQAGSGTAPSVIGCVLTNVGTVAHPTPASTNLMTQTRRFTINSGATAGALASTRVGVLECWRGNNANLGGFFVLARFGVSVLAAGMRAFIGLTDTATTAPTNVDPTTNTTPSRIGMAINANTGTWKLVHNITGTAPTVIDLGANFPIVTTDLLEMILFAKPNDSSVTYRIKNLTTGNGTSGTISSNLPASTAFLGRTAWATNNATAAAVQIDISRFGLETDF
jgi:hypothetical protein